MFEIVFLGTSASAPSIHRGLPAQMILAGEHRFLIDCGEGTQRQILRSGVGFKRLKHILLTHGHLDHILGLGGLVSTLSSWEDIEELDIYGGTQTLNRVEALLFGVVLKFDRIPIDLHLVDLDRESGPFLTGKDFTVEAFPVTHRGRGNFGFIFQQATHHPFLNDKAEELGIPAGPERGQLVKGETITLSDGRVITPDMVLGDPIPGVKLVHIGDVGRLDDIADKVADADVLIIEATFLDEDRDVANNFGHITAAQAAAFARDTHVKALILTHVSRRYRERDIRDEARAIFPKTSIARDLDHFVTRRGQPVKKLKHSPFRGGHNEGE
ncbi:MAG: ribonuclease Z [Chloroflexi bacterium]|nr:MAG: ribonuclease Z [Chloroflexota bacterium]